MSFWIASIRVAGVKLASCISRDVLMSQVEGIGEKADSTSRLQGQLDGEIPHELQKAVLRNL